MKKIIVSFVVSASLFLGSTGFAASAPSLYNPESRTDSLSVSGNKAVPQAGVHYAYWHRHWHRWHRWHRWHWHRWHHYHYW